LAIVIYRVRTAPRKWSYGCSNVSNIRTTDDLLMLGVLVKCRGG